MDRRILWFLALAFALWAPLASAAPTYVHELKEFAEVHKFTFNVGDEDVDTRAVAACAQMSFVFDQAGSDVVSVYQLNDKTAAANTGTLISTFSADSTSPVELKPGLSYVKAVGTTVDANGSLLTIRCSHTQISDSGTGGTLHPATGVDSEIRMGENLDFTTGGVGETVATVIDSSTDLLQDVTHMVSPLGLTGSERMYEAFVNDSGIAAEQEWIEWGVDPEYTCGSTCGTIATGTNPNTANTLLFPLVGGRINLVALSATSMNNNTGTDTYCEYTAYRSNTSAPADFSVTKGTPTDWTACTGTLHTGQNTANTGGVGETDGKVNDDGDHYAIPISDCQCATDDCVIAVAVADEIAGAPGDCDDQHHIHLRAFVTETYP